MLLSADIYIYIYIYLYLYIKDCIHESDTIILNDHLDCC